MVNVHSFVFEFKAAILRSSNRFWTEKSMFQEKYDLEWYIGYTCWFSSLIPSLGRIVQLLQFKPCLMNYMDFESVHSWLPTDVVVDSEDRVTFVERTRQKSIHEEVWDLVKRFHFDIENPKSDLNQW